MRTGHHRRAARRHLGRGALNAAFVASRPQTAATARELGRVWCALRREDVFPVSMRALVGGLCGKRDQMVPDVALRRLVDRYIEFARLEDAATPVHVVAYDVMSSDALERPVLARAA